MASLHNHIPDQAFDALVTAEARRLADTPRPDVQAALREFREKRISLANPPATKDPAHVRPNPLRITRRFWPAVAAAAIIGIAAVGVVTQYPARQVHPLNNTSSNNSFSATATSWLTITATKPGHTATLPDGSTVQLASQSSISYPANFTTDRQTRLSGDASFAVTHNPANPFRVQTKDLTITVLGTSFSITTIPGQTNIAVKEGLIEVTRNQHHIRIAAHEALTIPHDTGTWQKFGDTTIKSSPAAKPPSAAQPAKFISDDDEANSRINAMRSILTELVSAHCVPDQESIVSATLTPEALIVNDIVQPNYLFEKFKAKYLDNSGNGYFYGSVHITGRGYFFNKADLDAPPHRPRDPKARYDSLAKPHPRFEKHAYDTFLKAKPPVIRTAYVN